MKLLVIGSGGREHALAWKLNQSPRVRKVYVAPGNAGTALEPGLENIPFTALSDLVVFVQKENIALTIVGPESPLADGIVDIFRTAGLKIFGPTKKAAQLEASKIFSKTFMQRHGIPTAAYASFDNPSEAHHYIEQKEAPIIIKANGLAAGKGVVIATTRAEAHEAIDTMLVENKLGKAGTQILVEDYLEGEEASFIVMSDGRNVLPLATSQDHKRLLDNDQGPNTGGMGAYSPAQIISPTLHAKIMREIITPTIQGMARDGELYTGFLYAGLMITPQGEVKVLEFNCRMGDPETQPIMLRLKTDLAILLEHAVNQTLDKVEIEWDRRTALGVVMAAEGYPGVPRKNDVITGLTEIMTNQTSPDEFHIFHSGTVLGGQDKNEILTAGGRVLCVTALGENIKLAHHRAYDIASKIHFEGCQMRHDIGHKGMENYDR
ncbi:phosphoribosylamine--glycine ligase [Nitrosomonas sp. Nm132]|uniref:phosphoribosylamine--glycine ligase n=1 Tax=Nitrosomonas sp. Nm132 TaxID=1881053 RepID=UPI000889E0C6|nr:phosphoribosylamine--glycine ligase [Nitrosomonas sp. Nm132]SDH90692.1 phosphoribosylamine--glycine ligase [Nitrosomonas sp. Nm132]